MKIPSYLIDEVKRGNIVLFLGGQAFAKAKNNENESLLTDEQLKHKLCDHFLGGDEKNLDLSSVFDIAVAENDLNTVQDYLRNLYWGYNPSLEQQKISEYNWASIYSTNYNLIIERIYSSATKKKQRLVPIYKISDRIDSLVKMPEDVAYVKLHGCITKTSDINSPILISSEQYIKSRNERAVFF